MNIVYIGSSGPLSYLPLQTLINSKFKVSAIAVDSNKNANIPVINESSQSLEKLAFFNDIPLISLTKNISSNVVAIKKFQADIIIVSCYARKLPSEIISLAKIGCFNIHPSLLPKYRGPSPLFWQFRAGEEKFGVTLHRISNQFDQGSIIAQKIITMSNGISKEEAITLLAKNASEQLIDVLSLLEQGKIKDVVQDEMESSYQSYPQKNDYSVSISWTAKRMFNFICANKRIGLVFPCEIAGNIYQLVDAYSYQYEPYENMKTEKFIQNENVISFVCREGYIQCEILID